MERDGFAGMLCLMALGLILFSGCGDKPVPPPPPPPPFLTASDTNCTFMHDGVVAEASTPNYGWLTAARRYVYVEGNVTSTETVRDNWMERNDFGSFVAYEQYYCEGADGQTWNYVGSYMRTGTEIVVRDYVIPFTFVVIQLVLFVGGLIIIVVSFSSEAYSSTKTCLMAGLTIMSTASIVGFAPLMLVDMYAIFTTTIALFVITLLLCAIFIGRRRLRQAELHLAFYERPLPTTPTNPKTPKI